ncbi:Putative iron-regulated membrane protein (modular protein) [Alteromonas sp. 38]|uniref:PepSY-associated TM helix domain-containing protein n=2 Tax=Alteromonas TaxID=226 RepID=UPI0012EFC747|nr:MULTISPECIES: PepSY-associated TM helix domain-containing protein [unclassified Alteromonas]CAD5248200.1 Putative iron-regulated membrane protein (modular protein) [Alteromonas sp. 154]VXC51823.1 Putative iron-regulated membrane protein (modular protein) [Alteromonas sp. 38]
MVEVVSSKRRKRKLYNWHIWLGFNLAFLTALLLATGTIATISNEIDWLLQDDMRVSPEGEKVSWGEMEANAKERANPDDMLIMLTAGENDHFAYRATFLRANGTRYHVHVNQWTGDVTGTTPFLTVQRFFRDLHRYFFMPSFIGLPIVSSLAIVLMISLYTGLKTTGRLKKDAFRIRKGKGIRVLLSDLHKVAGIWSMWFITLMVITAFWYLIEFGFLVAGDGFEPPRPGPTTQRIEEFGDALPLLPADTIIARASSAFPNWAPQQILYPRSPKQAITVLGYTQDIFVRARANRVFLDPVSGDVIQVQKSEDIAFDEYLNEMVDPLHFGTFGKLTTKLIWFTFGLLLTGLTITGVMMTYKRVKKTYISKAQIKTFPILFVTAIFGCFYVKGQINYSESGELITTETFIYEGYILNSELRQEGIDEYHLVLRAQHKKGIPIIHSITALDQNGQTHAVKQKTFASTSIFNYSYRQSDNPLDNHITLNVVFASGEQKQFVL